MVPSNRLGLVTAELRFLRGPDRDRQPSQVRGTVQEGPSAWGPPRVSVGTVQDSPNPKGVLSSKASGEPGVLLSVSILQALRSAAAAAALQVQRLSPKQETVSWVPVPHSGGLVSEPETVPPASEAAVGEARSHVEQPGRGREGIGNNANYNTNDTALGNCRGGAGEDGFFRLDAPATVSRLKMVGPT